MNPDSYVGSPAAQVAKWLLFRMISILKNPDPKGKQSLSGTWTCLPGGEKISGWWQLNVATHIVSNVHPANWARFPF